MHGEGENLALIHRLAPPSPKDVSIYLVIQTTSTNLSMRDLVSPLAGSSFRST